MNADAPPLVLPPRIVSGLAIASLVCGLSWLAGLGSIAAIILGYLGLRQIRREPLRLKGRRMAIVGIVLGWIGIVGVLAMLWLGIFLFHNPIEKTEPRPRQTHLVTTEAIQGNDHVSRRRELRFRAAGIGCA